MKKVTRPRAVRNLLAVMLAAMTISAVPASADAATRQWWGVKLSWNETRAVANASLPSAKNIIRGVGLGSVVNVMRLHHIEAARYSIWQGRCLGITWVGSAVPGQRC